MPHPSEPCEDSKKRWPNEVELLLDAKRPGMEQRLQFGCGVEIIALSPEVKIRDAEQRRDRRPCETAQIVRRKQQRRGDCRQREREEKRGKQSTNASDVEHREAKASRLR